MTGSRYAGAGLLFRLRIRRRDIALLSGTTRAAPFASPGLTDNATSCSPRVRAGHLSFRDINEEPQALAAYGASLEDVRRRLHATDESGRLVVGADVMIEIWRLTPGERWLASLFGNPVMLPVTRFAYDRFADMLFVWNRWKGQ
jgi:predicted DCC family thiol-disulfide oxidoreductase YuxK